MNSLPQRELPVKPEPGAAATPDFSHLAAMSIRRLHAYRGRAAAKAMWAEKRGLWHVQNEAMAQVDAGDKEMARREALASTPPADHNPAGSEAAG